MIASTDSHIGREDQTAMRFDLSSAFNPIKLLTGVYFGIGVLAMAATVLLRDNPALVNSTVWGRNVGVLISAAVLFFLATRASQGRRFAFLRLRIVSVIVPVAIIVLIALPDPFPLWMKVEQALCGLSVLGVAILANRPSLRRWFRS